MRIARLAAQDGGIARLEGRLDATTAPDVEAALQAMVAEGALLVDFEQVRYVSSAGLRVLLKAAKQAQAAGRRFGVFGLQPAVREVFEISGFDTVIATYATLAEASAAG
ncbi:STAS domain-containing protein [Paracraurococcus ruber]|uniref:Anti-sigma factor antagonist n=1 Tax=Paracraurococcus ruber TaxID=77675 RepID=A0ABS1D5R3_9PROT|nr:STAS domain-containing protein [Paracraurococcus ruber]MBK1661612.1 anti-anti-sigma factor [Paracraurococcus ruber]TDG16630.1 anti-sigma factor antagonist [Paracraurococcus ruber]